MSDDVEEDNTEYGLIVSFEDQSASFVHGYEAGGIMQRMRTNTTGPYDRATIEMTVHSANRETLTRMAVAEGWTVAFTDTLYPEWVEMVLEKTSKAPTRRNPNGLRVV